MKNKLEAANYPNNQDQTQGSCILSRPDEVPVSNRMLHTPRYVSSFLPSALAPSVTEALQEKNMLRNSSSGPQVRHPQRNLAGLPSRRNLNKLSGRPRAGPETRSNGLLSKNGVGHTQNQPRRPIIRPPRDHFLVRTHNSKLEMCH